MFEAEIVGEHCHGVCLEKCAMHLKLLRRLGVPGTISF